MSWSRVVPASLYGPARRRLTPAMAGRSNADHVALTFDDGPDPASAPLFLDLLGRHDVRATFFLVGRRAAAHPDVVRQIVDGGHEIAVHGWSHRCVVALDAATLHRDVRRTRDLLVALTGSRVDWYRPPYGVTTLASTRAALGNELTPVLWTAWGRDWSRHASPSSVVRTVSRTLRPGGTVLLHDTDAYSVPGSWRVTLAATDRLLDTWAERRWAVGPLAEHGLLGAAGQGFSR